MRREEWECVTAAGTQRFGTYMAAVRWLADQPAQPATLHRVTRTHMATYGVPGAPAWPTKPPAPTAGTAPAAGA